MDGAAAPVADVRTVCKQLRHEMDEDDSFELSLTTKQMRLRLNSEKENASISVNSNVDMSVEDSISEDATKYGTHGSRFSTNGETKERQ